MRTWITTIMVGIVSAAAALGDTLELKNGRVITGRIIRKTDLVVWIEMPDGHREAFSRSNIKRLVEDSTAAPDSTTPVHADTSTSGLPKELSIPTGSGFGALPEFERQIANARAEFVLAEYRKVLTRVEPLVEKPGPSPEQVSALAWLRIDSHLYLGEFEPVMELLKKIQERGAANDKIRAKAYLDILEANAKDEYGLRKIGDKYARDFLKDAFFSEEFISSAKDPKALARPDVMRVALEEYCDLILREGKGSVSEFKKSLELETTLKAIREAPRTGAPEKYLPFIKDKRLETVRESLERVDAIIPNYAVSYRLDLVRIEAEHLYAALEQMFAEVFTRFPNDDEFPRDPRSGKRSKEAREGLRERCEAFVRDVTPLIRLATYMQKKVDAYPKELRRLVKQYREIVERLKGLQNNARRIGANA